MSGEVFLELTARFPKTTVLVVIIAVASAAQVVYGLVMLPLRIVKTRARVRMVLGKGWPPPHLDADGDWKPEREKEGDDE